jgi:hypothetical protein
MRPAELNFTREREREREREKRGKPGREEGMDI